MNFPELRLQLKALPPASLRLCLQVRAFIQEHAGPKPPSDPIIVGVSGGADSFALALILQILGYPIHIAHLDHALRPESPLEATHVKNFAAKYHMAYTSQRVDVQALATAQNIGLEEAGRNARYAFFASLQTSIANDPTKTLWLATGHHADDLAEDMLMRLIRGTGWPALGGMHACIPEKRLIRPLLHSSKEALTDFLTQLAVPWCNDPSNDSDKYTRNRIRHQLIPLCFDENPQFLSTVKHLWENAQDDHAYWAQRMSAHIRAIITSPEGWLLPRHIYMPLAKAERLRLYKCLIECVPGACPRAITLRALDTARTSSGKFFQFSKACIHVKKEGLLAAANQSKELLCTP